MSVEVEKKKKSIENEEEEEEEENESCSKTTTNKEEEAYERIKSKVEMLDIIFHPQENTLINVGLINGKLKIYDLSKEKKKRLVKAVKLHKKSIRKLAFAEKNSNLIFTASKDKSIKLYDLKHESDVLSLDKAHDAPINCLVTIDNWLIASADDNGAVKMWDYRRKEACMESTNDCDDYISDLAVSRDKKTLLATCGEGTLNAFNIKKKKMQLQSELMDSELLCVSFMKDDKKAVVGTGEGALDIFNYDGWGNISDRFPGHPSSIDSIVPLTSDVLLTGCFDGNIRACYILPNRFMGIVGSHDDSPVQKLALSSDTNVCASIAHDEMIKFWRVESLKTRHIDPQSKSKSKVLKNKKINAKGKADNFFADLIENDQDDDDDDDDDDSSDDSDDDNDQEDDSDSDDDSD